MNHVEGECTKVETGWAVEGAMFKGICQRMVVLETRVPFKLGFFLHACRLRPCLRELPTWVGFV